MAISLLHSLELNPRYFSEPEKYKPSRWYGLPSDSEVFSAFSIGARACIGRKFATVEAVAFLTMLLVATGLEGRTATQGRGDKGSVAPSYFRCEAWFVTSCERCTTTVFQEEKGIDNAYSLIGIIGSG